MRSDWAFWRVPTTRGASYSRNSASRVWGGIQFLREIGSRHRSRLATVTLSSESAGAKRGVSELKRSELPPSCRRSRLSVAPCLEALIVDRARRKLVQFAGACDHEPHLGEGREHSAEGRAHPSAKSGTSGTCHARRCVGIRTCRQISPPDACLNKRKIEYQSIKRRNCSSTMFYKHSFSFECWMIEIVVQ